MSKNLVNPPPDYDIIRNYPRPGSPGQVIAIAIYSRVANRFLRHSKGPRQGHSWDIYPDDYQSIDLAEQALREAPPPFRVVHFENWKSTTGDNESPVSGGEG